MERLNPDPLLTVEQSAIYLNAKPDFVRDLSKQRRITTVKLGRSLRVQRSELERYVREGTRPATRPSRRNRWS